MTGIQKKAFINPAFDAPWNKYGFSIWLGTMKQHKQVYNASSSYAIVPAMFHFAPKNALYGVNNKPN